VFSEQYHKMFWYGVFSTSWKVHVHVITNNILILLLDIVRIWNVYYLSHYHTLYKIDLIHIYNVA